MQIIEELRWRNMLHNLSEGAEEHLSTGMRTVYIGFDPTAPSMTIGNYVQIMLLSLLQRAGHKPIVLMGGATGRIGDPSGKDKERELLTYDTLDRNLAFQKSQVMKFLNFEDGENKAIIVNNYDFYKQYNVLDFLRDVGKNLTVGYMLSKESIKRRLETGISFTEFSYLMLQAYDFQCLYEQHNCTVQMGGSDQWGNITAGAEFIRKNMPGAKAFAVTSPLLTKADGSKFGKSEEGNIWLDPEMTSPYKFYQFWLNADDRDLGKFLRYFSFRSREEIEALETAQADDPRTLKRILAEEMTSRVHSADDFRKAKNVSELLFNPKADTALLHEMSSDELQMIAQEIPSFIISPDTFSEDINIMELMAVHSGISGSKGEARRAIQNNAVSVNKQKITSIDACIAKSQLLHGQYLMVENGKKNKFILEVR